MCGLFGRLFGRDSDPLGDMLRIAQDQEDRTANELGISPEDARAFISAVNPVDEPDAVKVRELIGRLPQLVRFRRSTGDTALHYVPSAWFESPEQEEIAQILLDAGADPNATDELGSTPLHNAVNCGDLAVTKLLIARGANVRARSNHGIEPIHFANTYQKREIVEILLKHGAEINARNDRGETLLAMYLSTSVEDAFTSFLKSHGATDAAWSDQGEEQIHSNATKSSSANKNDGSHTTKCPHCSKSLLWVRDLVGNEITCYICGKNFTMPAAALSEAGKTYTNAFCNFSLTHPGNWEVEYENKLEAGSQWTETVRLVGPMGSVARPYLTVVTGYVKNDGKGLAAYMDKAEQDLRNGFSNLRILSRQEGTLLGWPTAWMTYTYQDDSGSRQEMNVTTFFGREWVVWFQFICETDVRQSSNDFPIFERIVRSLHINSRGLRLDINLIGPLCVKCLRPGSTGDYPKPVFDPTIGNVISICDRCWKAV